MSNFFCLLLVLLCYNHFTIEASPNFTSYSSCLDVCTCVEIEGKVMVKCRITDNMTDSLNLPNHIDELDLSKSGLASVPSNLLANYTTLSKLSLRSNKIHTIWNGSFAGLRRLKTLDLAFNNLHLWKQSNLSRDLPALEIIDITGSIYWVPNEMLLSIPTLKEIIGVTWCKFCQNCTLVNPRNLINQTSRKKTAEKCLQRFSSYNYKKIGKEDPKKFVSHGVVPECMCVKGTECEFRQLVMPYFIQSTSLPQYLFYLEYVISPLTIIANLFVLVIIVVKKRLRKTPAFSLIINIAMIDILVGVYSISVAETNIKHISSILEELMWTGQKLRPSTGPLFIAGQLFSVLITSILTIERYICVTQCTTTNAKLTMKATLVLITLAWILSCSFALLPIFGVAGLRYNIKRACAPLSYDIEYQSESSFILIGMLTLIVVIYFANVPLYYKIFHFVKKNTGNAQGVAKEVSLAKKIAVLLVTKFIFFVVPIFLILTVSISSEYSNNPFDFSGDAFQSTIFKIIIGQWLPVTCLNINALLDPFLYAFRHTLFKKEVRSIMRYGSAKVSPQSNSCTDKSKTSPETCTLNCTQSN